MAGLITTKDPIVAPSVDLTTILADTSPLSESKTATAGAMNKAPRADHQHPRLTSADNYTLDANGFVTITFSRNFTTEPAIVMNALGSGTGPVPDFRAEFIKTGALWTGATVYGQRARALPTIAPLSAGLLTLLSSLIGALNPILASISGFAPYEAAAGARVSVVAIQNSSST